MRSLWDSGIVNEEIREFLTELAVNTPLPEMSDPAVEIFMDQSAADGERMDALRTIVALNDPRLPEITSAMVAGARPMVYGRCDMPWIESFRITSSATSCVWFCSG